jgi:tetratricopeptide (TPR) repeat protein
MQPWRTTVADPGKRITAITAILAVMAVIAGCSTPTAPEEVRDNSNLQASIYAAVPEDWRLAIHEVEKPVPLEVSSELRQFALSSIDMNAPGRERMLGLVDAILDNDRVGLKYDADATFTASEAFRSGTGNCLGFSHLLVASAREAGLNASYELVSHRTRWDRVDDVLFGTLHVRVVSVVGGGRMVFDFYPLPLESGYTAQLLSDTDAAAHHFNNLAVEAMNNGEANRAFALFYLALGVGPRIAFIWSNLGVLLTRHGFDDMAELALREALVLDPAGLNAMSNLQRLYHRQGRDLEAAEISETLREYRQNNPYYHAWLGEQAMERNDFREAVDHFKNAIDRKKSEPDFYVNLARSYDALGLDRAAARAEKKAERLNKKPDLRYRVGSNQPELGSHIPRN